MYYVEAIGKGSITDYPSLIAKYNKENSNIEVTAKQGAKGITKVEIIYRGETIANGTSSTLNKKVTEAGWYIVKVTDENKNLRYAWVKVNNASSKLSMPEIYISSGDKGADAWYRGNLEITISTNEKEAAKIYYTLNVPGETAGEEIEVEGKEVTFGITTQGRTTITAQISDSKGNRSEEATYIVKYDNTAPTIEISATPEGSEEGWYSQDVELNITGESNESEINGYWYYVDGAEDGIHQSSINIPLIVKREGRTDIGIQTVDKAGNKSATQTKTVLIDKTAPVFSGNGIQVNSISKEGFTINVLATDELSGNKENGGAVKYSGKVTESGTNNVKTIEKTENTSFRITEIKMNTRYDIEITAEDPAGNKTMQTSFCVTDETGGGSSESKPETDPSSNIHISTTNETGTYSIDGYYNGTVGITIKDQAPDSTASKIKYEIVNTSGRKVVTGEGEVPETSLSFDSEDGIFIIKAWTENTNGAEIERAELAFKRDSAPPYSAYLNIGSTTTNSITVIAEGSDACSGIANYTFEYKLATASEYTGTKTVQTASYTFEGLEEGILYDLKVAISDKAGNIKIATTQGKPRKSATGEGEILTEKDVGKYVNYQPQGTSYTVEARYSGCEEDQIFQTTTNLKWKIWKVDDEKVYLAPESWYLEPVELTLNGALGYNNGLTLIDKVCETAYGTYESTAAKARCLTSIDVCGFNTDKVYSSIPGRFSGTAMVPIIWWEYDKNDENLHARYELYSEDAGLTNFKTISRGATEHYSRGHSRDVSTIGCIEGLTTPQNYKGLKTFWTDNRFFDITEWSSGPSISFSIGSANCGERQGTGSNAYAKCILSTLELFETFENGKYVERQGTGGVYPIIELEKARIVFEYQRGVTPYTYDITFKN